MRTLPACAAAVLLLAACDPPEETPAPPPVDRGPTARLSGTYQVASRFELPAAEVAPGPLGDALGVVHGLSVNPAGALLDLAESSGAPAIEELRLVLPDALEGELEGWMNAYLETATVGGVSPHARIVELDAVIRSVLLDWELRSTLELSGGAAGTHTPVALAFAVSSVPVVIPVSATAPVTAASGVTATISWPDGPDGAARAAVSDHAMGVPFGDYALEAMGLLLQVRYGTSDPRAVLAQLVDCAGMAQGVASRCLGPLCVDHAAELGAVCTAGLDEAASRLVERIVALDYEAIRLAAGAALAEGAAVDAASGAACADRLSGGVWTATVDLGEGPTEATSTFTAARE